MEIEVTINKKDGTAEKIKYSAQEKYDKQNTVRFGMKLNKKTDADILAWLEKQESKQGAIKDLIRAKINETEDYAEL